MAKIVCDTNVLVSAFLVFDGKSGDVLQRVISGLDDLFVSESIIAELERVLIVKLALDEELCKAYISLVKRHATMVEPKDRIDVIKVDDTDNRILECAIEAGAEVIVSGDKRHILPLGSFRGVRIVSPGVYFGEA